MSADASNPGRGNGGKKIYQCRNGWLAQFQARAFGRYCCAAGAYCHRDGIQLDGRDHFIVKEGVESGNRFSVKQGYLRKQAPAYRPAAIIQFILSRKTLIYPGGRVRAFTDDENPIKTGTHPVQIPDFPHSIGSAYLHKTPYAKNWFFLNNGSATPFRNDRYLHPGHESAGCITVDPAQWNSLYQYLILCRSGDGKTVGMVSVVR